MKIKEIADMCGVDKTTVQRWIKKIDDAKRIKIDAKCIDAQMDKKEADFDLKETVAIIRAGGNAALADLLMQNAREVQKPQHSLDFHEARLACKAGLISVEEYRMIVGLDYQKTDFLSPKIARQVYAVASKAIKDEQQKLIASKKDNFLGLEHLQN